MVSVLGVGDLGCEGFSESHVRSAPAVRAVFEAQGLKPAGSREAAPLGFLKTVLVKLLHKAFVASL